jgi:hypothetical protein
VISVLWKELVSFVRKFGNLPPLDLFDGHDVVIFGLFWCRFARRKSFVDNSRDKLFEFLHFARHNVLFANF